MGELVNLRTVRKRKARADREAIADQNRVVFGRTRAEREMADKVKSGQAAFIEGHRRDRDDPA